MTGLESALAEARAAVLAAPDPEGALERLRRHVRRERAFDASPAALPIDDLTAARARGIPAHLAAGARR